MQKVYDDEQLIDDLAETLRRIGRETCPAMQTLWLEASQKQRQCLGNVQLDVSRELRKPLGNSSKSKYKALACWRFSCLWVQIERAIPGDLERLRGHDEDFRNHEENAFFMHQIYFTTYPEDDPPFAFSRSKFEAPELYEDEHSEDEILRGSTLACWATSVFIREVFSEMEGGPAAEIFRLGGKYKSLDDVLKLREFRERSPERFAKVRWEVP